MIASWRVEILGWRQLSVSTQLSFLRIVGEWRGEWWGEGRAQFDDPSMAAGCLREIRVEPQLKQRPVLLQSGDDPRV